MRQDPRDIPDPIARNRRERRLAWVIFAALLALAAAGWLAGGGDIGRTGGDTAVPAGQP